MSSNTQRPRLSDLPVDTLVRVRDALEAKCVRALVENPEDLADETKRLRHAHAMGVYSVIAEIDGAIAAMRPRNRNP